MWIWLITIEFLLKSIKSKLQGSDSWETEMHYFWTEAMKKDNIVTDVCCITYILDYWMFVYKLRSIQVLKEDQTINTAFFLSHQEQELSSITWDSLTRDILAFLLNRLRWLFDMQEAVGLRILSDTKLCTLIGSIDYVNKYYETNIYFEDTKSVFKYILAWNLNLC